MTTVTATGTTSPIIVPNLSTGNWTFQIKASNVNGIGPSSALSSPVAITNASPVTNSAAVRPSLYTAPTSFYSTPLPDNAPIASHSPDWVQRLVNQFEASTSTPTAGLQTPLTAYYGPPYNTQTSTTSYSSPLYVMPTGYPTKKVYSDRVKAGLQTVLDAGVPWPDPSTVLNSQAWSTGTDGALAIVQTQADGSIKMWEFWQASFAVNSDGTSSGPVANTYNRPATPAGYDYRCTQGGYVADIRTWSGFYSASSGWGVSACGGGMFALRLTMEDWLNGQINHVLGLALPAVGQYASSIQNPAVRGDALAGFKLNSFGQPIVDANRVPEGTRFRLPPGFDSAAWANAHHGAASNSPASVQSVELICNAIRDYGIMINDYAGVFGFAAEDTRTVGTPWSPYATGVGANWNNFGQDLPWSQMLCVAPTVAVGSGVLPAIGSVNTITVSQAQAPYTSSGPFNDTGAWAETTAYNANDQVEYLGVSWVAARAMTANIVAVPGSNPGCWVTLAAASSGGSGNTSATYDTATYDSSTFPS